MCLIKTQNMCLIKYIINYELPQNNEINYQLHLIFINRVGNYIQKCYI